MKRWWAVGAVLILFIIGAVAGGSGETDPATLKQSTSAGDGSNKTSQDEAEAKADAKAKAEAKARAAAKAKAERVAKATIKVNAGQIIKEFEGNEAAADAKYKGKLLEISGHVDKVDTEFFDDNQYVVRLDGGSDFAILSVNCNDVSAKQAAKVQADKQATVRGTFDDGGDLGVEVKNCEVL